MILRKVIREDWKLLLNWRNDIETRRNSHDMEPVTEEDHKKWLSSILTNKNRQLFLALKDDVPVGTVRADFDEINNENILSWTIAPDFRGKGIGKIMVKLLTDELQGNIRAEIKPGNVASVKIAEYAGLTFQKEADGVLHYSNK